MNPYQTSMMVLVASVTMASCSSQKTSIPVADPMVRAVPNVNYVQHKLVRTSWSHATTNQVRTRHAVQHTTARNEPHLPQLSYNELRLIGDKIFNNESGSDKEKLVHWNDNENFASMGIGHWTWYPKGRSAQFGNTFPQLLSYLESNNVILPNWLSRSKNAAPWRSKSELNRARNSYQVQQLKRILYETRDLQAKFILQRAERAIPRLVKAAPANQKGHVIRNVKTLMNSAGGRYALIDYINFKGEGLRMNGGYRGKNWGVLQVLLAMRPSREGKPALNEFANAAMYILQRRVKNSPKSRNEARWLRGWNNRINTYRNPWV